MQESSPFPDFAEAVRAIRHRESLSMIDFAKLLGVSQGSISRYESGLIIPRKPVLQHLLRLAQGVEKISIARAIGESLPALERKESKAEDSTSVLKPFLNEGDKITDEERNWLQQTLVILRSSKASILTGIIDSLHEGALLDGLAQKRKRPDG